MDQFVTYTNPRMLVHVTSPENGGRVAVEDESGFAYEVEVASLVPLVSGGPDLMVDTPQAFVERGRIIIATYHGPCLSCGRRCYSLNTGDNSGMGDNGESGMDPTDGMFGPHVPLCLVCANDKERAVATEEQAKATVWKVKPPRIVVDLSANRVPAEGFWGAARMAGGDGYDVMDGAGKHDWVAVSSWGRDGWDFLEWPYYVGYVRNTEGFEFATNCEGDVDVWRFPTKAERIEAMDRVAFSNWQAKEVEWVEGVHPDAIPPFLRGPYFHGRTE